MVLLFEFSNSFNHLDVFLDEDRTFLIVLFYCFRNIVHFWLLLNWFSFGNWQ